MKTSIVTESRYKQIADILRQEILAKKFAEGARFYSEAELAKLFGTTHVTIRNALRCLEEEGLIIRLHGKGTFIGSSVKREKLLGIIIPGVDGGVFPVLVAAIEETANQRGYSVLLCNARNDFSRERTYTRRLISKKVDGVVFYPILSNSNYEMNIECLNMFSRNRIPVATIDRLPYNIDYHDYDSVSADSVGGSYDLIRHLIGLGHRRIGVLTEPFGPDVEDRIEGYKKALRDNGIEFDPALVRQARSESGQAEDPQVVCDLYTMERRPTAIFALHEGLARFAIRTLQQQGVRVPENMGVVGFDDLAFAGSFDVPLTTVRWSVTDQGRTAVEMLLERIEGRRRTPRHVVLDTGLVVRESCGVVQADSLKREVAVVG